MVREFQIHVHVELYLYISEQSIDITCYYIILDVESVLQYTVYLENGPKKICALIG